MSETGTESGDTPAQHPPGRAEIIRRSLEAMNDDNLRQIRNVYVPPAAPAGANGGPAAEDPPQDEAFEESTQ